MSINLYAPLATLLRPSCLTEFIGQKHILSPNKALFQAIENGKLFSVIFWGPPGSGKTTLAQIMAHSAHAHFIAISAVMSGIKEIRQAVSQAQTMQQTQNRQTVLFVDEIHRFNKSQQDAFLPYIEDGTFIFIGATTENPSFELNNALLSRVEIAILKSHTKQDLQAIINRAIHLIKHHYNIALSFNQNAMDLLINHADGDARRLINSFEPIVITIKKTEAPVDRDTLDININIKFEF